MGTWSTALYGNDASSDIRGDLKELFTTPLPIDAILAKLRAKYALDDENNEDYADLWLALADQLHTHGIVAPKVFATARAIIDKGIDLKVKRALEMDERDLAKRASLLKELRAKWAKPHPKPQKRKIQSKADAFVFEIGDCVTFPMTEGDSMVLAGKYDKGWEPDAYGAFAVLARGLHMDLYAWYAVARLHLRTAKRPRLERCAAAMIESELGYGAELMGEQPRIAIFDGRLKPAHAKRLGLEVAGRLKPIDKAIRDDLHHVFKPDFMPGPSLEGCFLREIGSYTASKTPIYQYLNE
jgi:hypothetical protein